MKNRIITIAVTLLLIFSVQGFAQNSNSLKFNKDHTFKIAQFTDLHWENTSPGIQKTIQTIKTVLSEEKPDLAILTGDIVTAVPAEDGWRALSQIFAEFQVSWAVTLGNHDGEPDITREQIFDLLEEQPYFIGSKGPELYGCGNYALPVKSSTDDATAAVIYCMDSNDYVRDRNLGGYDWIHFDQIEWFRNVSDEYTKSNNNFPLPSLAFFHIPLVEFNNVVGKERTLGLKKEGVASAEINSGIFASFIEKRNIMGVFVGHDHNNNYIGIEHDIALAFGQVTGADAYGELERGSRIIEMREGEYSFNTWIRTESGVQFKYNYPSGLSANETDLEFLPATQKANLKNGIRFKYFEGPFETVDQLSSTNPVDSGVLDDISIESATSADSFGFEFSGWIMIPKSALYRFYTYSDDGSKLFIDGVEVVNNDGSHSAKREDGKIALEDGFHNFKVLYMEDHAGNILDVGISSINIRECKIPKEFLYTE
ncbi:PA14 domain-containing protein [Sunxiuqinia sp. A32]|uniref:PA14 domain-containing protein n=1 Tax=Sunxiuqinia sp. A32 TaxID=3461496 RepID=UPI004045B6E8